MSDRWVISHTGKKGGPWEANDGGSGDPTTDLRDAARGPSRVAFDALLKEVREVHPSAKVFRLVRRSKTKAADRENLGKVVREIWIEWAREQPSPKASWLVPWEGLSEPDKEVDRRIGERLASFGAWRGTTLERAVVEAAMFLVESNAAVVGGSGALASLRAACAALRAKRGG